MNKVYVDYVAFLCLIVAKAVWRERDSEEMMRELRVRAEKLLVRSAGAHALCSKWLCTLGWLCFAGHISCVCVHRSRCCSFWIFFVVVHKTVNFRGSAEVSKRSLRNLYWRFLFKLSYFFMIWGSLSLSLFLVNVAFYFYLKLAVVVAFKGDSVWVFLLRTFVGL